MGQDPYQYFRIEARELLDGLGRGALDLEKNPQEAALVARLLRLAHTLKGAARVVKRPVIAGCAHLIEDALVPFRDGQGVPRAAVDRVLKCIDDIGADVDALDRPAESGAQRSPRGSAEEHSGALWTDLDEVDILLDGLRETSVSLAALDRRMREMARLQDLAKRLAESFAFAAAAPGAPRAAAPLAPVRELQSLAARLTKDWSAGAEQVDRELRQVRETAARMRFVPAARIFHALERTVRDTAQSVGKRVLFEAKGGEVRVDPSILAAVQSALVQTARNAVAHGIETETERTRAGKSAEGHVFVEVTRRGNEIVFRCQDDGGGVDVESVRRAVERSDAGTAQVEGIAAESLLQRLLEGGISTSGTVTEVSGRGVGLDVVRDVAHRLGGRVQVQTEARKGTVFEIAVPVSLSALEVVVVEAGGRIAAIPREAVRRAVRLDPSEIATSAELVTILFEGQAIPFAPLARALRGGAAAPLTGRRVSAVVVEDGGVLAALGIDRLRGTEAVVWRPLPEGTAASAVVAGTSLDAQGNPQLVLDPQALLREARRTGAVSAAAPAPRPPILVIDDSLTTRMLEQSILESAGYAVDLASCAEEGLEQLRRRRYGLILVDVEMPGMSGFEFIEQLRADPALRDIPAFLVTSLCSPEDLRRGTAVGAQAYIVKSQFDQADLLDRIRALVG